MKSLPTLAKPLLISFSILVILSGIAAIYFETTVVLLIPVLCALGLYCFFDYKLIYYLLIFCLPLSKEFPIIGNSNLSLPSEGLILVLAFIYIITLLFQKNYDLGLLKDPMIMILLLLYFWAVFEYLFTIDKLKTIKYIIAKTVYYLVFLFLTFSIIRSKNDLKKFIFAYTGGLFIGVLFTIILHAADGFSFENINHLSSIIFVNHVYYATVIGIGIPLTWFLLKTTKKTSGKQSFYLKFILLLFLFALITSYTRGSWLALIICIIFYQLLNYKKVTLVISMAVILVISSVTYLFTNDHYLDFASDYTTTIFHEGDIEGHLAATYSMKDVSGMERVYRWVAGANMVKEKPVMGSGPGTFYPEYKKFAIDRFRTYVSDNPEQSTTHNNFLLFLTEQGLVGFLLFATLVIMVFIRGSKIYHETSDPEIKYLTAGFYLAFTSIVICMMFSDFTESDKVGTFFLVSITILAKINQWNKEEEVKSL